MSAEKTKTITLYGDAFDIALSRRVVGSSALLCGVTVVSFDEHPGHIQTKLVVTVSGHPRGIREFHDMVRGDAWSTGGGGDIIDGLVVGATVEGFRFVKRKWQARNDPPEDTVQDPTGTWTVVYWRRHGGGPDGDGIGTVWVDTYEGRSTAAVSSEQWPQPTRRSEALSYAQEHGFDFFPDE